MHDVDIAPQSLTYFRLSRKVAKLTSPFLCHDAVHDLGGFILFEKSSRSYPVNTVLLVIDHNAYGEISSISCGNSL